MREFCEFRVKEKYAHFLFRADEGIRLGQGLYQDVRKTVLETNDPRYQKIDRIQRDLHKKDTYFYAGWDIFYEYTDQELQRAEVFRISITATFEPTGKECGTEFDESTTCSECGAGRTQASDLILDIRKAPKSRDIAKTIARDEWIVSQRLAELMVDAKLAGFDLQPVRHKARYQDDPVDFLTVPSGRKLLEQAEALGLKRPEWAFYVWLNRPEQKELSDKAWAENAALMSRRARRNWKPLPVWYQLIVTSRRVPIVPPTRTGIDPFDEDVNNEFRCPYGHVIGLNLLSEVSVAKSSWDGSDVAVTAQMIGCRRGLLVPSPCLLVSPRFYKLLKKEKIKGYKAEIAHLV